jgi:hypothetical protein
MLPVLMKFCKKHAPGRKIAVFVVSPILAKKGIDYEDTFIKVFAGALFLWDGFWLVAKNTPGYTNFS